MGIFSSTTPGERIPERRPAHAGHAVATGVRIITVPSPASSMRTSCPASRSAAAQTNGKLDRVGLRAAEPDEQELLRRRLLLREDARRAGRRQGRGPETRVRAPAQDLRLFISPPSSDSPPRPHRGARTHAHTVRRDLDAARTTRGRLDHAHDPFHEALRSLAPEIVDRAAAGPRQELIAAPRQKLDPLEQEVQPDGGEQDRSQLAGADRDAGLLLDREHDGGEPGCLGDEEPGDRDLTAERYQLRARRRISPSPPSPTCTGFSGAGSESASGR